MGVVKPEEIKTNQSKLEVKQEPEDELKLPDELPDKCNFQYCEVKRALKEYIDAYQVYLECKDSLDKKKASIQVHTDWSNLFSDRKPTVADKEAHITLVTMEQRMLNHDLYIDKLHKEKLYELEVMRYQKEE